MYLYPGQGCGEFLNPTNAVHIHPGQYTSPLQSFILSHTLINTFLMKVEGNQNIQLERTGRTDSKSKQTGLRIKLQTFELRGTNTICCAIIMLFK